MQQNILRHTKKQTLGTHRYGERSYRASHQRGKKPHLMQQSNHCKHKTCCLMRSMNSMLSQAIAMEFTVSQPTTHNSPNLYTYFSSSIFSVWAHSSAWQSDRLITGRPGVQTPLGPLRYWFFIGFKTIQGVHEKDANGRRDSIIVDDDGSLPIFPKKCHLHNTISNPLLAHGIL